MDAVAPPLCFVHAHSPSSPAFWNDKHEGGHSFMPVRHRRAVRIVSHGYVTPAFTHCHSFLSVTCASLCGSSRSAPCAIRRTHILPLWKSLLVSSCGAQLQQVAAVPPQTRMPKLKLTRLEVCYHRHCCTCAHVCRLCFGIAFYRHYRY